MKILLICQYYAPEPFRVSDLCEEMVRRGHEVMVVTGEPNYPEGEIYPGYENHAKSDEVKEGVRIHRCPIIPRKTGALYRMLNYYSYANKASKYVKSKACAPKDGGKFDVVLVYQLSPVMMAKAGIAYGKKHGVPVVMYCLDLWPESIVVGGIDRKSAIFRHFHRVSGRIYTKMDRILITSRMFKEYLQQEFGVRDGVVEYLPQYAEGIFENVPARVPEETINVMFAGNIGAAQSVDTILKAAQILTDAPVKFHIVGGGSELRRLKQIAEEKKLENVTFYGRQPLSEMPGFYGMADVMLVTLNSDPVLSRTLPGKVQSYMAVGKPIIGAINGETEKVIRAAQCGFCGPAEDAAALAENIRCFMAMEHKEVLGKNAKAYYDEKFEEEKFMDKLENELKRYQAGAAE